MIKGIEINISNGVTPSISAFIYKENNIMYIDNKTYPISNEKIDQILSIISTWKYEYGSDNNIDTEEFYIIVRSNKKETKYHGKGMYPNNYGELKKLLGDIIYG